MSRSGGILLALVGSLVWGWFLWRYHDFVLDDAFISFRYAENLASGAGLRWNVDEPPVEGYTNFLWVLVHAAAAAMGADAVVVAKILGAAAGLACLWLLALQRTAWPPRLLAVSSWALCPAFALLTMQGLETSLAALLLLVSAVLVVGPASGLISTARLTGWHFVAVLSVLTRPDSLIFQGALWLGLVLKLLLSPPPVGPQGSRAAGFCDRQLLRPLLVRSLFAALVLAAYVGWRWSYFGYPFPNTYYVKLGTGEALFKTEGIAYLRSLLGQVLWPSALAGLLWLGWCRCWKGGRGLPLALAVAAFLTYLLTIVPIQGFLWRFAMPVVPAVFFLWMLAAPRRPLGRRSAVAWSLVALVVGAWPLRLLQQTDFERDFRNPTDRVLVGQALADIDGRMLVSDSGAVPYYSGWASLDLLGLTSEVVAHEGLSAATIEQFAPDLIMGVGPVFPLNNGRDPLLLEYMQKQGFVGVAAIQKTQGLLHFYFVRRSFEQFEDVARRLTTVAGVKYADLRKIMRARMPIYRPAG